MEEEGAEEGSCDARLHSERGHQCTENTLEASALGVRRAESYGGVLEQVGWKAEAEAAGPGRELFAVMAKIQGVTVAV